VHYFFNVRSGAPRFERWPLIRALGPVVVEEIAVNGSKSGSYYQGAYDHFAQGLQLGNDYGKLLN
jgi:hypothetical protein